MRVVICPDKFAGTISAVDAAAAVADGWRSAAPGDVLRLRPLADGGPGFLDVLAEALGGRRVPVPTVDPLGRPVEGTVLLVASGDACEPDRNLRGDACEPDRNLRGDACEPDRQLRTAYVESADACGLHLLSEAERDPKLTTSYGLGVLLVAAVESGAREVVVGLGGSGVNDAGAGMLAALGTVAMDAAGQALPYGGAALSAVAALDGAPRLRQVPLIAAGDVDNPLLGPTGASAVFGPQKGASPADVALLDAALATFAEVLERDLPGCPPGLASLPSAGAAGGLGAALLALGARRESGIGLVRRLTGLDRAIEDADLVITGEGSFDAQSLRGKVVAGAASAARERGIDCVVLAGVVSVPAEAAAAAGVTGAYSLVEATGSRAAAMADPAAALRLLGARLARARHTPHRPAI